MPTLTGKKKKLLFNETGVDPIKKKETPQFPTANEIAERISAQATTGATADRVGSGTRLPSDKSRPGVEVGQLKPEFQAQEDVAAQQEAISKLPLEEQLLPPPEKFVKSVVPGDERLVPAVSPGQTALQILKAAVNNIGLSKITKVLRGGTEANSLTAQAQSVLDNIERGVYTNPNDIATAFNIIDMKFSKLNMRTKLEGQGNIAALLDGSLTDDEEDFITQYNKFIGMKADATNALRTKMQADIIAQTEANAPRPR